MYGIEKNQTNNMDYAEFSISFSHSMVKVLSHLHENDTRYMTTHRLQVLAGNNIQLTNQFTCAHSAVSQAVRSITLLYLST